MPISAALRQQPVPSLPICDADASRSLCVDLDGTLVATDVLWESVVLLVKHHPWLALRIPFWLLHGKAYLKRQLAARVRPNPATLPYRSDVVDFVQQSHAAGRETVLATASDVQVAREVAAHLGCFSCVVGSDGVTNLSGTSKSAALVRKFGARGFDYIGDGHADVNVWTSADGALLVNPSRLVLKRAGKRARIHRIFCERRPLGRALLRALRVHQWVKNLLLFVPLVMAHQILDGPRFLTTCVAFVVLSLLASSVYISNDLLDLESDRQHPRKRGRPFAAGDLSVPAGVALSAALFCAALVVGMLALPRGAVAAAAVYALLAWAYSYRLKRIVVVDVVVLAMLYVIRLVIGGVAAAVLLSHWLLAFSMFLFLSLALMKRHAELTLIQRNGRTDAAGRGYLAADREWVGTSGIAAGYLSVLVLALYITSDDVEVLYRWPTLLWPVCMAVLLWISRLWALAYRGSIEDDPVLVTLKDPASYVVGGVIAVLMFTAAWMWI